MKEVWSNFIVIKNGETKRITHWPMFNPTNLMPRKRKRESVRYRQA